MVDIPVEGEVGLPVELERGSGDGGSKKAHPSGTHKLDQVITREATHLAPPYGERIRSVCLGTDFDLSEPLMAATPCTRG